MLQRLYTACQILAVFAVLSAAGVVLALLAWRHYPGNQPSQRTTQQELAAEGIKLVQKAAAAMAAVEQENRNLRAQLNETIAELIRCDDQLQAANRRLARMRSDRNAYSDQSERFEARAKALEAFITANTCVPVPAEEPSAIPTLAPPEVR